MTGYKHILLLENPLKWILHNLEPFTLLIYAVVTRTALIVLYFLVPTWIRERPGSIHIAYVCCDADCQDAVHQGDEATVPLVTPGPIHVTQDEVERDPE